MFVLILSKIVPVEIDGVKVDVSEFISENVPFIPDQTVLEVLPDVVAAKVTEAPAQTDCAEPAFTPAKLFTKTLKFLEVLFPQGLTALTEKL